MLILQKWHKNFLQKEEILIVRLGCLETQKKKKRRTHLSPSISTKMRSFAFMFFRHFVYMPNLSTRPYTAWLQGVSNHTRTIFSPSWRISFRTDWPVNNMHMCQSCLSQSIKLCNLKQHTFFFFSNINMYPFFILFIQKQTPTKYSIDAHITQGN